MKNQNNDVPLKEQCKQVAPFFAITGLCFINYGWGMNSLGVHSDDWFWLSEYYFNGFKGVVEYGSIDRLLIGLPFGIIGVLVGLNVTFWHLAVIVLHICSSLLVWLILQLVLPKNDLFVTSTTVLFALHPSVSVVIWLARLPSILSLTLFLLSLYFTVYEKGSRTKIRFVKGIAMVLSILALLIYELPLVLEPMRILLILIISKNKLNNTSRWIFVSLKNWTPYLFISIVFLVWRLLLAPYVITGSRGLGLGWPGYLNFIFGVVNGIYQTLIYAWRFVIYRLIEVEFVLQPWIFGCVAIVFFVLAIFILYKQTNKVKQELFIWTIGFGFIVTLLGNSITVAAGFPIPTPASLSTRVNSVAAIGVALITTGAFFWFAHFFFRPKLTFIFGMTLLIGLCTANNYTVSQSYIKAWERQQDLWWQIAWRAPTLAHKTYLLVSSKQSLSALGDQPPVWGINNPLAFLYGNRNYGGEYLDDETITRLSGQGLTPELGSEIIPSNKLLVVHYGDGCVKFADSKRSIQSVKDSLFEVMAQYSNLTNILSGDFATVGNGLRNIVVEPLHEWCYYYQQAEYFLQKKVWFEIINLFQKLEKAGFKPDNKIEWLPFIIGLNNSGHYEEANLLLANSLNSNDPFLSKIFHTILKDLHNESLDNGNNQLTEQLSSQLNLF